MAKVLKTFRDRHTKRIYRPGDDYQGSSRRLEELSKLGYVAYSKEKAGEKVERPADDEKPKKKK